MKLVPLDPMRLEELWPEIVGYVEKMAEKYPDDWPVEVQVEKALAGILQLWLVVDEQAQQHFAMVGTRITIAPSGNRFMEVATTSGIEHRKWVHLIKTLEADAAMKGCHRLEIRGREGWARYMPNYTVRKDVVLTKELARHG